MYLLATFLILLTNRSNGNDGKTVYHDAAGVQCRGDCGYHGWSYQWCNIITGGWNYCSTANGLDYRGSPCSKDCDYYNRKTRDCGTGEHCGTVSTRCGAQKDKRKKIRKCISVYYSSLSVIKYEVIFLSRLPH